MDIKLDIWFNKYLDKNPVVTFWSRIGCKWNKFQNFFPESHEIITT